MRHQGYALAETVFGVCSEDNVPLELAQQDRFPSGDESSASLQVAFARPNLQLMESMESKAIETIMKRDGVYKLPKSNYDLSISSLKSNARLMSSLSSATLLFYWDQWWRLEILDVSK